jgi:type II secretory pathway pseudopilin PulG
LGQGGFTLVGVLAAVALVSIGLSVVGPRWDELSRRDQEQELIHIGTLYAQAIASYYEASPGSLKRFPATLDDLLEDRRFVGVRRHLRQLYPDPIGSHQPWGLVMAKDGGVRGVFSRSELAPVRSAPLDVGVTSLPSAQHYTQWKFVPTMEIP